MSDRCTPRLTPAPPPPGASASSSASTSSRAPQTISKKSFLSGRFPLLVVHTVGVFSEPSDHGVQEILDVAQLAGEDPMEFFVRNLVVEVHHPVSISRHERQASN